MRSELLVRDATPTDALAHLTAQGWVGAGRPGTLYGRRGK